MIQASGACLPALIAYAARLGEHKAYEEAHPKRPLLEGADDARELLVDATDLYNKLDGLEVAAGEEYTERVRRFSIALAHLRTIMHRTADTDSENEETRDASGREEVGGVEGHAGDAGGETDVQRKEQAMRGAYEKCVHARVNAARLKGEKQALGCTTGDEYTTKKRARGGQKRERNRRK